MAQGRSDNEAEPRGDAGRFKFELVITERQPCRQWHREPPFDRPRRQSTRTLLSAFEAARPEDFPTAIWKTQRELGMRRFSMNDVHCTEPEGRSPFAIAQLLAGERRIRWKTKSTYNRQQRLGRNLVVLTERVRVMRLDAKKRSQLYDRGAIVHVTSAV
jgi:hypothetical protein